MLDRSEFLSAATVRALLRRETATKQQVRYIALRLQKIRKDRHIWSINQEVIYLEKQLTRELARLNKINAIFIKFGCRLED